MNTSVRPLVAFSCAAVLGGVLLLQSPPLRPAHGAQAAAQVKDKAEPARAPATLREGDNGPAVEALQRLLNARLDPSPELTVDGDFGPATRAAVIRYQRSKGITPTGTADARTRESLGPALPPGPEPPAPEVVNARRPEKRPADPLEGPPFVTSKAWAVVDGRTGELVGGFNEDNPLDMASTTKMMTAMVVLRIARKDPAALDETVVFSERADRTSGSTSGVKAGERLPVRELLYGLLLPSGNDAAVAFGEHFGGRLAPPPAPDADSEPAGKDDPLARFVAEMNRVASELGLSQTHFDNPHGLTAPGHRSSARDLARLARLALAEPVFADRVSTPRHGAIVVDAEGHRRNVVWTNTNRLLDTEGYDGVKTGTTSAAGNCLVASGRRGGDHLIVVVLGSGTTEGRYADARNLFRWGWLSRARHAP
jgi:D-alanyl-D-alanine carboxypeptidase (penicillin-binding protein 5/6)